MLFQIGILTMQMLYKGLKVHLHMEVFYDNMFVYVMQCLLSMMMMIYCVFQWRLVKRIIVCVCRLMCLGEMLFEMFQVGSSFDVLSLHLLT